jgi:Fic family protein
MKGVIDMLNGREKEANAIIAASKIHHKVAWIHPFTDGNGRVARLLLNLRLMRSGFPPVVLEKKKRIAYYSALEKADAGDLYPITTFIANAVEESLDVWLSAV